MLFRHANRTTQRLDEDAGYTAGYAANLVKAFRMRMQLIRDAESIQSFYALKSLHFEKLHGKRKHQHSMRLNDQFRLIVELERDSQGRAVVVVKGIEDYH